MNHHCDNCIVFSQIFFWLLIKQAEPTNVVLSSPFFPLSPLPPFLPLLTPTPHPLHVIYIAHH